jgi:SPP1 family predicted phage head-tail adaptor
MQFFRVGEFDQRITIQRETRTPDGGGGSSVSLVNVATNLYAHVRPRSGKEVGEHTRVEAPAIYLFVIRNRSDIKDTDRILWCGDTYNIRFTRGRGTRARFLEIDAERGVTQ